MSTVPSAFSKRMCHTMAAERLILIVLICLTGCSGLSAADSTPVTGPAAPNTAAAPTLEPGDSQSSINVDGLVRSYILHIPPGVDRYTPVPVVFVFHDYSKSVAALRLITKFDDFSDSNGFVVVYPKGIGDSWNAGDCCGYAFTENVNDNEFVRQIISQLESKLIPDPQRIYAAGFSNGAMMAYRLGCDLSGMFAAIATVQGPLFHEQCLPEDEVSLVHIHGTSDPFVPYAGGESMAGSIPILPPVETGVRKWAQWNDCSGTPTVNVDGAITHFIYPGCTSNAAVELYTLDGLEHAWPSPVGAGDLDFPATQTIWDFFAAHPKTNESLE